MRRVAIAIAIGLTAVVLAVVALCSLAVEREPRVERRVVVTPEMVERAKAIIDNHRRRIRPAAVAVVNVRADDLDLAANYLVHRFAQGKARVSLGDGSARLEVSAPVGRGPVAGYLNVDVTVVETQALPQLAALRVGRLPVPAGLAAALAPALLRSLGFGAELEVAQATLLQVRFSPRGLAVVYRWSQGAALDAAASSVIGAQDRERLRAQQVLLAENTRRGGAARISLAELLPPLMQLAAKRSASGEAAAENRAAILVATMHTLRLPLRQLVPEAAAWPQPARQAVTLDGRDDLAKHFLLSATIAAYADTLLADAVGLYKEIEDARSGSGFSFDDLAADRAGTRFGHRAVAANGEARALQQRVGGGLRDADLMPPWRDLPASLPERVFRKRFGGIDTPAYQQLVEEIDSRVASLPVLR